MFESGEDANPPFPSKDQPMGQNFLLTSHHLLCLSQIGVPESPNDILTASFTDRRFCSYQPTGWLLVKRHERPGYWSLNNEWVKDVSR